MILSFYSIHSRPNLALGNVRKKIRKPKVARAKMRKRDESRKKRNLPNWIQHRGLQDYYKKSSESWKKPK
jgi:hypothetical protein